ncbi:tyrosine-protein kinase SRK2-like [Rhinatrema bivittatum]|uniref:tyrosine-protein kinase SRK2-like n=1 Tax=Rhinatrema bivittatum TaxID=194408 RepID=UPI00112AA60C|nr:tyrosine-protein kinase SRK2-like [Rhinatrema bivittatum]
MGLTVCKRYSSGCDQCPRNTRIQLSSQHNEVKENKYVSIRNYKPRTIQDLRLQKGDHLQVLEEQGEWLYVAMRSQHGEIQKGFIPREVLAVADSLESENWYFGVLNRLDARRFLLNPRNDDGAFQVWKNEEIGCYYLSVRCREQVRHYKILGSEKSFHIVERKQFRSLSELVKYYSHTEDGLCTRLKQPCVKLDVLSTGSLAHNTIDCLEIHPSSIKKIEMLGSGNFGNVWLAVWNETTKVAIKELNVSNSLKDILQEEAETMRKLNHERLLKLYAICLKNEPAFIVTEFMKNGNLQTYLETYQVEKNLEPHRLIDFAVQVAQGMDYLETKHCIHRDLRTANILLTGMLSCKIGDFGLARFADDTSHQMSKGAKIPIKWMAPEVFTEEKYSIKSDVWSFGILLLEIMTYGIIPFPDISNITYVRELIKGNALIPPQDLPKNISNIMLICWRNNPSERPSFKELEKKLMELLRSALAEEILY